MTVEVNFTTSEQDNVLLIPDEAVKHPSTATAPGAAGAALTGAAGSRPSGAPGQGQGLTGASQGQGKKNQAAINQVVTYNNGVAEVHDVTVGGSDGTNTAILSGLKDGDTVVLAGFDQLGLSQFSSGAKLPGFLTRGPLGTGSGGH
jgi:multidrug efflux pump subunit AcrA (membrane-fusion protein)